MKNKKTLFITQSAMIAALYVAATYAANLLGLASGAVQLRISEALTVFPAFTFAAVPGLFIGCAAANLLTGCALWDVVFGSAATLIAAFGTYKFGKTAPRAAFFPIAANTVVVPFVLRYAHGAEGSLPYFFLTVFAGELISCGVFGGILYKAVEKSRIFDNR